MFTIALYEIIFEYFLVEYECAVYRVRLCILKKRKALIKKVKKVISINSKHRRQSRSKIQTYSEIGEKENTSTQDIDVKNVDPKNKKR